MGSRAPRAMGKRARKFGGLLTTLRERALGKKKAFGPAAKLLSQRGIVEISSSSFHRYEREGRVPDVLTVLGLADLYKVSYDWLLASLLADLRNEPMPPEPAVDPETKPIKFATPESGDDRPVPNFDAVRLLADRIAAGPPLEIDEARTYGYLAFTKDWLEQMRIARPLCVRVGRRERSMMSTINPGDVVLLDCSEDRRINLKNDRIYAVNVDGGSTVKRIAVIEKGLALISDNPDKEEYPTRTLEVEEDKSILDVVVGEVMWRGQDV